MRRAVSVILVLALGYSGLTAVQMHLDQYPRRSFDEELLYLPNDNLLIHFTGGMGTVIADVLWLKCIKYVVQEFNSRDAKYTWLEHMCMTISRLDPYNVDVHRYGAIFLAALKADGDAALKLLRTGYANNPTAYELPYEAAMVYFMNRRDEPDSMEHVLEYLGMAVATGNAPPSVQLLISRLGDRDNTNRRNVERSVWENLYETADEGFVRELAERKLILLTIQDNCNALQQVCARYEEQTGHPPKDLDTLADAGMIRRIEPDPLGGTYFLDDTGMVQNSSLQADLEASLPPGLSNKENTPGDPE